MLKIPQFRILNSMEDRTIYRLENCVKNNKMKTNILKTKIYVMFLVGD